MVLIILILGVTVLLQENIGCELSLPNGAFIYDYNGQLDSKITRVSDFTKTVIAIF